MVEGLWLVAAFVVVGNNSNDAPLKTTAIVKSLYFISWLHLYRSIHKEVLKTKSVSNYCF